MKQFFKLIIDFFRFPFQSDEKKRADNNFAKLLGFLFRDFPAYFWKKPSLWRGLLFPFMLITVLLKSLPKRK